MKRQMRNIIEYNIFLILEHYEVGSDRVPTVLYGFQY